ncbi:MAG TPA: hypothetical protein VGI99_11885 [Gemmataceae bacterium]|jgi:hypothetical protein
MRKLTVFLLLAVAGCLSMPSWHFKDKSLSVEQRVQNAIERLNDNADMLHNDRTPAVWELSDIGEPAVEPLLPYLFSDDHWTRVRAENAIEGAIMTMHGRKDKWPSDEQRNRCDNLFTTFWDMEANGGKTPLESSPELRMQYVERIRAWLHARRGKSQQAPQEKR